jgi:hypothetical protein
LDLISILNDCCAEFRKGAEVTTRAVGNIDVTDVWLMPHVDAAPPHLVLVDVHFMIIGVKAANAAEHREDLIAILEPHRPLLERGPSFMTIAQEFEIEQDRAFHLMAVGEILRFWRVMTPSVFRLTGTMADRAAAAGYVMISGYEKEEEAA